jgi:uncharacterized membrane protein
MEANFGLQTPASASDCRIDGAFQLPFAPIATNGAQAWSMTFTEAVALASPQDARNAGFGRLLGELGYSTGSGNKGLSTALAKFHAAAKIPVDASAADLFSALEADVNRAAAQRGYTICNDGDAKIWAALGFRSGTAFVSRGWWEIAAGACALAIDNPLGHDAVYLFASKHGSKLLVSGPSNFCISNAQFDIHGNDACAAHGGSVAGFLATNLKGLPGFTVHIGNDGVVPP